MKLQRCQPAIEQFEDRLLLATFIVTDLGDNGDNANPTPRSLRAEIEQANATSGSNIINFAITGATRKIVLASALPTISNLVLIDGTQSVNGSNQPGIELIGTNAGPASDGLVITAGNSTVRGFYIEGFGGEGIALSGRGGDLIQLDGIGIDASGNLAAGNGYDGIIIKGTSNNQITNDIISSNGRSGVLITDGASSNSISNSFLGLDASGTAPLGNGIDGVTIQGSSNNTVGASVGASGNVISANTANGVAIEPLATPGGSSVASTGNVVLGNSIGTNFGGTTSLQLGNLVDGVAIEDSPGNTIGALNTLAPGQTNPTFNANLISGNGADGIQIIGHLTVQGGTVVGNTAAGNLVLGNLVGTDMTGNLITLGNSLDGIFVDGASNTTIGGTSVGARNLVSGNRRFGVAIVGGSATANLVEGDYVGTNAAGVQSLGNSVDGVFIGDGTVDGLDSNQPQPSTNNTIGGTSPGARNVISGNGADGIKIQGQAATGNVVQGNYIGTDPSGEDLGANNIPLAPGNAKDGIVLTDATDNLVGGTDPGAGNLISGNSGSGIEIVGNPIDNPQGQRVGSTGTGNLIEGNLVGLDETGTRAVGNLLHGVSLVNAARNTVGGTSPSARNVLSGNNLTGVNIQGNLAAANLVEGNFIGTDRSGTDGVTATTGRTIAVGNFAEGVFIINASDNAIGGTSPGAGNVISGNRSQGISINGSPIIGPLGLPIGNDASGNLIAGNEIGVEASGLFPDQNGSDGVLISTASGNTVGGITPQARNVISNNAGNGIQVLGRPIFDPLDSSKVVADSASGNVIEGNDIGTDKNGGGAGGNRGSGILLFSADDTTIGGTAAGAGNVISGNVDNGVEIGGGAFIDPTSGMDTLATRNVIQGNRIGTTGDGRLALGNGLNGVTIDVGAGSNSIGGSASGAGNIISANFASGVAIIQNDNPGVTANLVQGNRIGTDATGQAIVDANGARLGNSADGVFLSQSARNVVDFNLISGNNLVGVDITGQGATGNQVFGNLIGTDSTGSKALGNFNNGLFIANAPSNLIGLPNVVDSTGAIVGPLLGNLISGNEGIGIQILGSGSTGNLVQGNRVGTTLDGSSALANLLQGILINNASANTIGGTAPGASNLLSANQSAGIQIQASSSTSGTAVGNAVVDNRIGTDAGGGLFQGGTVNRLGNAGDGPQLINATQTAIIGNLISSNGGSGVEITRGGQTSCWLTGSGPMPLGARRWGTRSMGSS